MIVNEYEKTYVSVFKAVNSVKHLNAVVEFLQKQTKPVTCAEIGKAVFGDDYNSCFMGKSYQGIMGQMLRHLRDGGFIKMEEHKGDRIDYETFAWIPAETDVNEEPPTIVVHDDNGRTYTIDNPNYTGCDYRNGHWGTIKKTIFPTIKTYTWIA